MVNQSIAVAIPCLDAGDEIENTIQSLIQNSSGKLEIEFGLVDDGSLIKPLSENKIQDLQRKYKCKIHTHYNKKKHGVAVSRNAAVQLTSAPIVLITDAHIRISKNWDLDIISAIDDKTALALTICDTQSQFRGYGCSLVVPFMGTHWVRKKPPHFSKCEVASSAGTVVTRSAFNKVGGFDEGMRIYGAIEPEFSLRLWLSGIQIRVLPETLISHAFKDRKDVNNFLAASRTNMIHNSLRFGILYLDDNLILQMLRYYSKDFEDHFPEALELVNDSDVWEKKDKLDTTLQKSFSWFCQHLRIKDQSDNPLWGACN